MSSKIGTTTFIFADNGEGYFAAHLDNGGIRIGLRDVQSFNIPPEHTLFPACSKATDDSVESVFDKLYEVLDSSVKARAADMYR